MVITKVSADDVLKAGREALGLPALATSGVDDSMLAAALRRAAGSQCPCSPATLIAAVIESLAYLVEDDGTLAQRVAAAADGITVGGDLLELADVSISDPGAKSTWVVAAPPAFIVRPSGSIFITGIVLDEVSPLPAALSTRIAYERFARVLIPQPSEDLPSLLRDLGLVELSAQTWLKPPRQESANDLRDGMTQRLKDRSPSGAIPDIEILDPARDVDNYRHRWVKPSDQSGTFVARRPQAYGAPLWGFAALADGAVTTFLDFPLRGGRWRGCDAAWHLQMALDHCRGTPQRYRRRLTEEGICLDFFSPLPQWAERRLATVGHPAQRKHCLLSYWIPPRELSFEEAFLQDRLWLRPRDESEQRGGE